MDGLALRMAQKNIEFCLQGFKNRSSVLSIAIILDVLFHGCTAAKHSDLPDPAFHLYSRFRALVRRFRAVETLCRVLR